MDKATSRHDSVEYEGPGSSRNDAEIRGQLRGSTLLLAGRILALGLNFATQVLIARALSVTDYGAFFYALSIVALWEGLSTLGMKRGISRFVPIFHERGEYGNLLGTIGVAVGTTLVSGLVAVALVFLWQVPLPEGSTPASQGRLLIYILIFLVPLQGLDLILMNLFASFAESKAIFFRRFVLGPSLKLLVVASVLWSESNVVWLASGYLAAEAGAFLIYSGLFLKWSRRQQLLTREALSRIRFPAREVLTFSLATLSSDFLFMATTAIAVLILGMLKDSAEVAYFRVVVPAARFNTLVMASMAMLYTPAAARLFARNDLEGLNQLYWRTAGWVAVLSFPIFALTFPLAEPLAAFVFGETYRQSGMILSILAIGYYFSAALGYNGVTLKVLGKIRYTVTIDLLALAANLLLAALLIPAYGALGAACSTAGTVVLHNLLKQAGLKLATGLDVFAWSYVSFYLVLLGASTGLVTAWHLSPNHPIWALALVLSSCLAVAAGTRNRLAAEEVFPELTRFLAWLGLGKPAGRKV